MVVYYGAVKNKQVVFDGDVPLADGQRVEVRPQPNSTDIQGNDEVADEIQRTEGLSGEAMTEDAFKRHLRAVGALAPESSPRPVPAPHERRLIEAKGQLLSEQIRDERR